MKKQIVILLISFAFSTIASAQTIVKGRAVNQQGKRIEYVIIGLENDSMGTISDANGNFTIEVPANRNGGLIFTDVSYQKEVVPS